MTETQDCPDCEGTGFTLTMDVCTHGIRTFATRPPMAPDVAEAIEETAPSVYDYDLPAPTKAVWAPPTGRATMTKAPPKAAATPAQEDFIRRLIAERDPTSSIVEMAKVTLKDGTLTAKRASDMITALMALPKIATAVRPNNYRGDCHTCGTGVEARAGRIEKIDGNWRTFHLDGECPSPAVLVEMLAEQVTEPGIYSHDGYFYRVKRGKYDRSAMWAERLVVLAGGVDYQKCGRASFLKASEKITVAKAREFGVLVGSCIYCGLTLDGVDGKSATAGYGETCSKNNHLPYPSTADMKAIVAGDTTWDDLLASKYYWLVARLGSSGILEA